MTENESKLSEAIGIIERLHAELYECLTTYAMTEPAQAEIMRLLRESTLFRRTANSVLDRNDPNTAHPTATCDRCGAVLTHENHYRHDCAGKVTT